MPKVSVIVPIYGVEKYIRRCAESLFSQTLDDIEFIFIDDCSPDKSMEILYSVIDAFRSTIEEKHWSIRIERMPHNSGQAYVRRYGMSLCSGDFVIHCDSDDWVDINIYKKLYERAVSNNLDIVWCGYYRSDGSNHRICHDDKQRNLMQGPLWNKLVKRTLYTENEIIYPISNKAEDGTLMTQISYYSLKRAYIDEPLYYYYINRDSICGKIDEASCLEKLKQECNNVDIRIDFLTKKKCIHKYDYDIAIWKYTARNNLLPLIKQKKYWRLWRQTYPEIERFILFDHRVSLKTKIGYLKKYFFH